MSRSRVPRWFVIVLSIVAVVALGLLLAQDQETVRPRSAVSAEDTRFPEYLAALVGADVARGNRYEVFTNGDQFFPAMLAAINQARTRHQLRDLHLRQGPGGRPVHRRDRTGGAAAACKCQLTVDAVGASTMEKAHVDRLRSAGCAIVQFNTPSWYSLEEINYRTHRKILVIDGEIAFTGGAGVADHWLGHAQDPEHWRDTQVRATGPIARLLEGSFYENVIERGTPVAPVLDDPKPPADDESPTIVVQQLAVRRQQRPETPLPPADCQREEDARHHHPVLRHRRVLHLGARRCGEARREGADPGGGGRDRRDAGQVRLPPDATTISSAWASRFTNTSRR